VIEIYQRTQDFFLSPFEHSHDW